MEILGVQVGDSNPIILRYEEGPRKGKAGSFMQLQ